MRRLLALLACAALLSGCPSFARGPLPGEPATATFAVVDGVRLRYLDVGSGRPVVLVHGFGVSLDEWLPIIPDLVQSGHRVLALDLKGFGFSDRPPGDYSPQAEASLVLHLMDQRGIEASAGVGHSWGASVVLAAALAAPERFSRIALYDGFVYTAEIPTASYFVRAPGLGEASFAMYLPERLDEKVALAFFNPDLVTQDVVDAAERAMDRPGTVAAALATVRGTHRIADIEGRYGTIKQPTLLLWGREDGVTPLSFGERLASDLPHAKLLVYPRCGHLPMFEARVRSTSDLVDFLAEAPAQ